MEARWVVLVHDPAHFMAGTEDEVVVPKILELFLSTFETAPRIFLLLLSRGAKFCRIVQA